MSDRMIYAEYKPPRDLAPWVACFWRIAGTAADDLPFMHRVLPDGCADLLFDLGAGGAAGSASASADLIGPMTMAHVVELRGAVDVLGVRLRPGAVAAFGGMRADELLDTAVPMFAGVSAAELADAATAAVGDPVMADSAMGHPVSADCSVRMPADAPAWAPAHAASAEVGAAVPGPVALVETAGFAAQLRLVVRALRAHVAGLDRPDPLVSYALGRWVRAESPDFPSVSVLTRDLGLSERAFERRFVASVGLTPVGYRRLARLRTVLRLHAQGSRGWASIAATTGFSDQAHLVRDCRAFTGLTPTEWAASQVASAGFLQDGTVTTG